MSRPISGFVASLAATALLPLLFADLTRGQDKKADKPAADKAAADAKPADLSPEQIVKDPAAAKGKKVEWQVTIIAVNAVQFKPPEFILGLTDKNNKFVPNGAVYVNASSLRMEEEAVKVYEGGKEKGKHARFKLSGQVVGVKKTKIDGKDQEVPELSKATLSLISNSPPKAGK